jgi:hypothetical protein
MAQGTRCDLNKNSQTPKAETKLKFASHCIANTSISSVECG